MIREMGNQAHLDLLRTIIQGATVGVKRRLRRMDLYYIVSFPLADYNYHSLFCWLCDSMFCVSDHRPYAGCWAELRDDVYRRDLWRVDLNDPESIPQIRAHMFQMVIVALRCEIQTDREQLAELERLIALRQQRLDKMLKSAESMH